MSIGRGICTTSRFPAAKFCSSTTFDLFCGNRRSSDCTPRVDHGIGNIDELSALAVSVDVADATIGWGLNAYEVTTTSMSNPPAAVSVDASSCSCTTPPIRVPGNWKLPGVCPLGDARVGVTDATVVPPAFPAVMRLALNPIARVVIFRAVS